MKTSYRFSSLCFICKLCNNNVIIYLPCPLFAGVLCMCCHHRQCHIVARLRYDWYHIIIYLPCPLFAGILCMCCHHRRCHIVARLRYDWYHERRQHTNSYLWGYYAVGRCQIGRWLYKVRAHRQNKYVYLLSSCLQSAGQVYLINDKLLGNCIPKIDQWFWKNLKGGVQNLRNG